MLQFWTPANQQLILESWYICKQPAPFNRERGPLPSVYQALVVCIAFTHSTSMYIAVVVVTLSVPP